jgi:hypothetical protein
MHLMLELLALPILVTLMSPLLRTNATTVLDIDLRAEPEETG